MSKTLLAPPSGKGISGARQQGAKALRPLASPPEWALGLVGRALFGVLQPNIAPICRYVYPNNPDAVDSDLVDPTPVFHAVLAVLKADVPNLEAGETGARRNSVSHTT